MNAPLCKDCLHFNLAGKMEYRASHTCGKSRTKAYVEPVIGDLVPARNLPCCYARDAGRRCGPEGKLFEKAIRHD